MLFSVLFPIPFFIPPDVLLAFLSVAEPGADVFSELSAGLCDSEEVCHMSWFAPMPIMNGSVVMDILVESNGLGLDIEEKR